MHTLTHSIHTEFLQEGNESDQTNRKLAPFVQEESQTPWRKRNRSTSPHPPLPTFGAAGTGGEKTDFMTFRTTGASESYLRPRGGNNDRIVTPRNWEHNPQTIRKINPKRPHCSVSFLLTGGHPVLLFTFSFLPVFR